MNSCLTFAFTLIREQARLGSLLCTMLDVNQPPPYSHHMRASRKLLKRIDHRILTLCAYPTHNRNIRKQSEPRAPAAPASSDQYKKLALEGRFEWLGEDERPAWLCGEFDVAEPEEPTDENDHVVYFLLHNKRRTSSMLGQVYVCVCVCVSVV